MFSRVWPILLKTPVLYALGITLGLITGVCGHAMLIDLASYLSEAFMNLLKLVSVPILFLSIVTVSSGMENMNTMAKMGKKIVKYTLLTTILAATFALLFFLLFDPVCGAVLTSAPAAQAPSAEPASYWRHLLSVIPSNIVQPFAANNVIGVLVIALFMSLGMFAIPVTQRETLHNFFSALYSLFMKITGFIVRLIPIALWAFIALFVRDVQAGLELKTVGLYLATIVSANLFQALVVLPLFLKWKGVPVKSLAIAMMPALTVAFFTKSSSATVPSAVRCAEERAKIQQKVASFGFPLCTSINMNACAAFILTTVLFVAMLHGMTFQPLELVLWIFMATLAAVGNASVPMGCFFLAGAFLAAMDVPLNLMGVILPFYAFLDAMETSINVWSDSCVVAVVDKELQEEEKSVQVAIA